MRRFYNTQKKYVIMGAGAPYRRITVPIHEDFHVSVFIKGPDHTTALIRISRPTKPTRPRVIRLWKFPGGKVNRIKNPLQPTRNEYPEETAVREVQQETGLILRKRNLVFIHEEDMGHYSKLYYATSLSSWARLRKKPSEEFESARVFNIDRLDFLRPFHERYRKCFMQHIKPRLAEL